MITSEVRDDTFLEVVVLQTAGNGLFELYFVRIKEQNLVGGFLQNGEMSHAHNCLFNFLVVGAVVLMLVQFHLKTLAYLVLVVHLLIRTLL